MRIKIDVTQSMTLSPGQLVSMTVEAAFTLRIEVGLVWLTIEGDGFDYWLGAGEIVVLPAARHIVIETEKTFSHIAFFSCADEEENKLPEHLDRDVVTA